MSRNRQPGGDRNQRPDRRRAADITVAGLLAAAGGLHLAALPGHLRSSAVVGAFFAVTAVAQLIGAVLVATRPSRRLAAAVVAGNLALLGLWALSRTTGLPLGGELGAREPLAALDGLAAAVETLAVAGALRSIPGRARQLAVRSVGWQPVLAVGVVWLASGGVGTSLAEAGHHHHDHGATTERPWRPIPAPVPAGSTDRLSPAPSSPEAARQDRSDHGDHPHQH